MSKVINIFTGEELTELPFKAKAAKSVIKHLLNFKAENFTKITMEERVIIDAVLRYVANASGTNANEMFIDVLTKIEAEFGIGDVS